MWGVVLYGAPPRRGLRAWYVGRGLAWGASETGAGSLVCERGDGMGSMKRFLRGLFTHEVEVQPRIVELEHPIRILGLAVDTNSRRVARDVARLGGQFEKTKKEIGIPNRKEPWGFAAVSKDYDEAQGTFWYMMGDVVTSLEEVPGGLIPFEIPPGTYAVFPVRPKNRWGWAVAITSVKRYAYTAWLPGSGYEPAGTIDDFEYHDERSIRKDNPEIDLYVAIREKP